MELACASLSFFMVREPRASRVRDRGIGWLFDWPTALDGGLARGWCVLFAVVGRLDCYCGSRFIGRTWQSHETPSVRVRGRHDMFHVIPELRPESIVCSIYVVQ